MHEEPRRVYADTSVYGGVFDSEFSEHSTEFFSQVRQGRFQLVTSALVEAELEGAPAQVQEFFESLSKLTEFATVTESAVRLRSAYLDAEIVSNRSRDDALHIALATISNCPFIVSWNFRHIVHIDKAPRYNAVNVLHGFATLGIHSPAEVIRYEEEQEGL